jgi:tetratricopeptide (TPR) repeat protein
MTISSSQSSPDPHFLRPVIVALIHAEDPQAYSIAPLAEWVWVLLLRCLQDEEPQLGELLLRRFWKELEAAGPLDRLERYLVRLMPRLSLTPSEKLHYGDLWVRLLTEQGQWLRANQLLTRLDALALTPAERAQYANRMGVYLKERGKYETAAQYLQEALRLGYQIGDDERVIISLNNLGNLEFNRDHFEDSIAYFEAIRSHPAAGKFPRWQGAAAAGLAMNWAGQKEFARAAAIMDEAERLYGDYRPGVLRVWVNRAYYEAQAGNLPHAFLYGQRALELARTLKEPRRESFALHNLGVAYYRAGQWREAIDHLQQALAMRQALDIPLLIQTTQEMLTEVQLIVDS